MIIDTHSHCYWDTLSPRIDDVITAMRGNSISHAIQIGCDIESSKKAIGLARQFPGIFYATVGFHPADAQKCSPQEIQSVVQALEEMIVQNREYIVGIGETGLDYHYLGKDPERDKAGQYLAWELQAGLAKKYNLPLIIHTRDAREDTLDFIKKQKLENIIMHCYSENQAFAEGLIDYSDSVYFSFSGILTYPKATAIQEAASYIPLSRLLVETDAPFLAPQSVRGSINEPANVRYVLEKLCSLRLESPDLIEGTIYENSKRVYRL